MQAESKEALRDRMTPRALRTLSQETREKDRQQERERSMQTGPKSGAKTATKTKSHRPGQAACT